MHYRFSDPPPGGGYLSPATPLTPAWAPMGPAHHYGLPDVMSELPEYLRNWVHAISHQLGVDRGLSLSTLLAGMGAAVQGTRMVRLPHGGDEPLACFTFVLAGPTTGKTRTHRLVHQVHNEHDIRRYQAFRGRKVRPGVEDPEGSSSGRDVQVAPRLRPIVLQDTSRRGLIEALDGVGESTTISVDEGAQVLGTALLRHELGLGTLNSLYDGSGKAMLRRSNGEIVAAHAASLTVLIMVQPDIFQAYLRKYGDTARNIGFLSRCLFTTLPAVPEWLYLSMAPPEGCLEAYHAKASSFLDVRLAQLESGDYETEAIHFSPGAAQLWSQLVNEQQHLTASQYRHVQDAANRSLQNVTRIAGIIHCYSDEGSEISTDSLMAAWAIVQWSLGHFARIFPPQAPPAIQMPKLTPQQKRQQREIEDCQTILNCIVEACVRNCEPDALKSKVFIRSGLYNARFRTALMRLVDEGQVLESGIGSTSRISIVPLLQQPGPLPRYGQFSL